MVSAVEVLYSIFMGSSVPQVTQVFPYHLQDLSVPAGEKEAASDRLCPLLHGLAVAIPPLNKVP